MRESWEIKTVGEVCEVIAGQSPSGKYYNNTGKGLPFHQGKKDFGKKFLQSSKKWTTQVTKEALPGDILMSVRAPVGPINFTEERICIGRGLAAIRAGKELDKNFLFYQLLAKEKEITGNEGAVFSSINKKQISEIKIGAPPIQEQKRIVAILDEAFEDIEKAQANAEKNLANARELYDSYTTEVFAQITDGKLKTLEEVTDLITCGVAARPKYTECGIPFLSAKNVKKARITWDEHKFVSEQTHHKLTKNNKPCKGDLLYTRVGSFGEAAIVDTDQEFSIFVSLTLIKVKPCLLNSYLKYYLNSPTIKKLAEQSVSGSGVGNLNVGTVRKFPISLPPLDQQKEVCEKLAKIEVSVQLLEVLYEQKLKDLAELKQSLLQKAFSGDLTSSNVVAFARPAPQQAVATTTPEFGAHVIAYGYHWHEGQRRNRTYGHVKTQKFLHLAESIAHVDMGRSPEKCAAGPHDAQHMRQAEDWAKANQFFEFVPRSDSKGYTFKKLANYNQFISDSINAVKPYKDKIQKILFMLLPMNTREAEVLATVHAAWNNLLLDNVAITDDAIIYEARENWTESKRSIPENEFRKAIKTIRNNGFVPDGRAKRVTGQENLF